MDFTQITYKRLEKSDYLNFKENFKYITPLAFNKKASISFGAFWKKEAIGIVVLCPYEPSKYNMVKLYVLPVFRNFGIGQQLIFNAEKCCKEAGGNLIKGYFNTEEHNSEGFYNFFQKSAWHPIHVEYNKVCMNYKKIKNTFGSKYSWGKHPPEFLKNFTIKKLNELNTKEQDSVEQKQNVAHCLKALKEFRHVINELSIFLLENGNVIGWIIVVEEKGYEEVLVEATYIEPVYRKRGIGMILFLLLFEKIESSFLKNKVQYISYNVETENRFIISLYDIIFKGCVENKYQYYVAEKCL